MRYSFAREVVKHTDGSEHERELLLTESPDGEVAATVATDEDRVAHGGEYDLFKHPEKDIKRQLDELQVRHDALIEEQKAAEDRASVTSDAAVIPAPEASEDVPSYQRPADPVVDHVVDHEEVNENGEAEHQGA